MKTIEINFLNFDSIDRERVEHIFGDRSSITIPYNREKMTDTEKLFGRVKDLFIPFDLKTKKLYRFLNSNQCELGNEKDVCLAQDLYETFIACTRISRNQVSHN